MSLDIENIVDHAVSKGADICILEFSKGTAGQVRFADASITAAKTWRTEVLDVFLVKDGRTMSTTMTESY